MKTPLSTKISTMKFCNMARNMVYSIAGAVALLTFAISTPASATTTTICHIPPGNPAAAHTITIGTPAVAAHMAHGDTSGACTAASSEVFLLVGCQGAAFTRLETLVSNLAGGSSSSSSPSTSVTICHLPPGNPSNANTITIGMSALAAHLAHGDAEGQCGSPAAVLLVTPALEGTDELADCLLPTSVAGVLSPAGGGGSIVEEGRQSWLERR